MAAKDDRGRAGEQRASEHLVAQGYEILDRNWRCDQGELDIVAAHDGMLCIVEVKTRRSTAYGHPFDAIDDRKHQRLWRLGAAWCAAHPDRVPRPLRMRIDVIGIVGEDPADGAIEHWRDVR